MRVFVAVDLEGIAGVVHSEETNPDEREYSWARQLMTQEANAAIAGIFEVVPDAEVTVADVHGPYRNLVPDMLDSRVTLLRGKPRQYGMMDGIDRGYHLALFLGAHAQAGAWPAVLSHTFTSCFLTVLVNGIAMGEIGLNAALAGAFAVPVGLVAGDDAAVHEAIALLGDSVVGVVLKRAVGYQAAETVAPAQACAQLRAGTTEALRRWQLGQLQPFQVTPPVTVQVAFTSPFFADLAMLIDGVNRLDGRTIAFTRPTLPDAYRVLRLLTVLCSTPR